MPRFLVRAETYQKISEKQGFRLLDKSIFSAYTKAKLENPMNGTGICHYRKREPGARAETLGGAGKTSYHPGGALPKQRRAGPVTGYKAAAFLKAASGVEPRNVYFASV